MYGVVQCGVVWYGMVWYVVVQCGVVWYGVVWYVRQSTSLCVPLPVYQFCLSSIV